MVRSVHLLSVFRFVNSRGATGMRGRRRTGRQALLELLGLVGVLEHQGVEVLLAADLELDVADLLVLLDPRGCNPNC